MTLIDDARRLWLRFWSVRLSLLSALLSAAEFALPLIPDGVAEFIGRGKFAAAAFAISMGAAVARIVPPASATAFRMACEQVPLPAFGRPTRPLVAFFVLAVAFGVEGGSAGGVGALGGSSATVAGTTSVSLPMARRSATSTRSVSALSGPRAWRSMSVKATRIEPVGTVRSRVRLRLMRSSAGWAPGGAGRG